MGILGKIKDTLTKSPDEKFADYQEKMISKNPNNAHLWLKETYDIDTQSSHAGVTFAVYNTHESLRYIIKGSREDKLQRIKIYDAFGKIIGTIHEKRLAFRRPFSREYQPADYDITIDGEKLGKVYVCYRSGGDKPIMRIDYNNWKMFLRNFGERWVEDADGNIIAEFTRAKRVKHNYSTFLDYVTTEPEKMFVVLAIILEAYDIRHTRTTRYGA